MIDVGYRKKGIKRRTVLQIMALAGVGGFGLLRWFSTNNDTGLQVVRRSRILLGTEVNLSVYGRDRDQLEAAVGATFARMESLEEKLSRYRPTSEVSRLNRTGHLEEAGPELLAILQTAALVSAKSDGAFDVTMLPLLDHYEQQGAAADAAKLFTLPEPPEEARRAVDHRALRVDGRRVTLARPGMSVTLDGIGKGYIVDQGVAALVEHGCNQVYVEAGGDLAVRGGKAGGEPWRIGLRPPRSGPAAKMAVVAADTMAVATSGDYFHYFSPDFRHHHIIDPRVGFSAQELASCTVTAPDAALADALATACMVLGPGEGSELLTRFPGCEGYFVGKDLTVSRTPGFPA
ncbi:FAD:protein FMN transferase [Desulfurivibrio sp. C05AmB]|uniref:FAD:protein FMN transferase n=1 Tax=Desulfurivibrio sp. C05AmB TaxID=3374371 RepID=UPI00376F2B12